MQCFNFNLKQKDTKSRETKNEPNKNEAQNEINNYSTVTSQRSFLSLESRIIDFPHGEIEFIDGLQRLKRSYYVRVPVNADIEDVARFMAVRWLKRSPKIIIPIVTGLTHFKPWKNQKQLNKFKRGLIKAAYTTDLWYITNGYNIGVSKVLGDAFREESLARRTNDTNTSAFDEFEKLTLIGIVSTSELRHEELLRESQEIAYFHLDESESDVQKFDLNPDHTHFILVDDDGVQTKLLEFRVALEKRLRKPLLQRRFKRPISENADTLNNVSNEEFKSTTESPYDTIPIVCLLLGGGVGSISLVQTKLMQGIPILVFKGTGHAPDLISTIYEDFADRLDNVSDNHLRTAITIRITEKFPKESKDDSIRNKIKDNILQIIKYSVTQDSGRLLTFIDALSINSDLHDLDKYILIALLQSQPSQSKELLKKNLMLIMDWNRPDIALSEIFHRDGSCKLDVEKFMFERALLKKNREEFIEIFLDQGFQIHRFLNHIKMFLLFEKCEDREFFLTICMEKGMGIKLTQEDFDKMRNQPPLLFQRYINPLVKRLSDIDEFFQVLEMSLNALKLYIEPGEFVAERKALVYLIVFAVLLKRHKLAKILWKRTDQPICVALLCSMMYKRASLFCHESYVKSELEEYSKDFAKCAVAVLDISFSQSDSRAYDVLNRKNPDLNNLTAIELAYNSNNKDFIAHPCCQKWITKKYYGGLDIRQLNCGLFKIPTWMKILLSSFLIFPMYFWIVFPVRPKKKSTSANSGDVTFESNPEDDDLDEEKMIRTELMNISTKSPNDAKKSNFKLDTNQNDLSLPFKTKLFMLWSAPITKFWVNLIFYIIYLCLFGLAVLWPACGNIIIDTVVWFWTALICCETTRRTYNKYVMGSNLPLKFSCFEIIIILIFLILYLFIRILGTYDLDVLTSKSILCCGLIYFYYRSVFVYLPISPTLGPMLVKMKYMVRIDFLTFLRMFIVFMAAGGITINAIVYPYYPLNTELLKRVFLRAFFGLFVTEKDDLSGRENCRYTVNHRQTDRYGVCSNLMDRLSFDPNDTDRWAQKGVNFICPYPSVIGWAILIQYLLLVKLFLTTLLTAMFSHTKAKVDAESDQIWMFQRYEIVIDYEQRLRLPPPLTIISYTIMLVKWLAKKSRLNKNKQQDSYNLHLQKSGKFGDDNGDSPLLVTETQNYNRNAMKSSPNAMKNYNTGVTISKKQYDHSNYWKIVVQDYAKKLDDSAREKDFNKEQAIGLFRLREDLHIQKKNLKRLDDRLISVERNLTVIQVTVEYIKHFLTNKEALGLKYVNVGQHIMARQSPYPFTQLSRFPVFDKYVSWDTVYDSYDPPKINVDKNLTFVSQEIPFTDADDLNLIELSTPTFSISESELYFDLNGKFSNDGTSQEKDTSQKTSKQDFDMLNDQSSEIREKASQQWNKITTCKINNETVVVDRTTWITQNGFPLQYQIDSLSYPINPMGRTGARGIGALYRWGPNHEIRAIVTRWRKYVENPKQPSSLKYIHVEGRRMLEFLACKDALYGVWKLPGGKILGNVSQYNIVCSCFSQLVFEQANVTQDDIKTEEDMKKFFANFACETSSLTGDRMKYPKDSSERFTAKMIYKGYIDDPRNTDNAWVEAEIWNFHYPNQDKLNDYIPNPSSKWKEVSSHVRLFSNQRAILKEVASIHEAYY